ncbi:DsbA family oxidoreductase [Streptomyces marincola]|nr:DsbA family oxidoreductase [Streptomyces marincola]
MSEMTVEIWSDLVCPWCQIGKGRFEAALARFDAREEVTVVWRSYQLDPQAPTDAAMTLPEDLTSRHGLSAEQVAGMIGQVGKAAAGDGITFRLEEARPTNTFDAHRLAHHAATLGLSSPVQERLMSAYTQQSESLADHDTLVRLAEEAGCDPEGARRALADGAHADAVREDIATARQLGLSGVPAFVFDRAFLVSGAQPVETFTRALTELRARSRA